MGELSFINSENIESGCKIFTATVHKVIAGG